MKDLEAKLNYITEAVPLADNIVAGSTAGAGSGAFCISHRSPYDRVGVVNADP